MIVDGHWCWRIGNRCAEHTLSINPQQYIWVRCHHRVNSLAMAAIMPTSLNGAGAAIRTRLWVDDRMFYLRDTHWHAETLYDREVTK